MIVTAAATAFPGEPVTTEELLSATGHRLTESFRKSVAHMGVGRRFAAVRRYRDYLRNVVPRELTHTTTDLGREAALSLLEAIGTAENADAVIAVTNTPTRPMPGFAFDLMADLHGLVRRDARVFNITYSGCSGFMKAMELATSLIESGRCRTVLLVVSEVHTAYWPSITQQVDSYQNVHRSGSADDLARTHQATAAFLFGDGAVAFLVSADGAGLAFGNLVHLTNDKKNDAELLRMNQGGSASGSHPPPAHSRAGRQRTEAREDTMRDGQDAVSERPGTDAVSTASKPGEDARDAGQAIYSPLVLRLYDIWVLGISNRFVWKCPSSRLVALYNRNVGARHLDIGVGSGYFLDKATWPVASPDITLADLNPNSLAAAHARIARYGPGIQRHDAFERFPRAAPYESIGLNYLLHCLPGDIRAKSVVFDNLDDVMHRDTRVFGATIVQGDAPRSVAARRLMDAYNRKRIFSNSHDRIPDLAAELERRFVHVNVERVGCVALFEVSGRR